jgi:hypothetical protein
MRSQHRALLGSSPALALRRLAWPAAPRAGGYGRAPRPANRHSIPRRLGDMKLFEPITICRLSRYATAMSAVVLRTAGSWCPLASPPGTAVSAGRRPVSRRHIPPDGACPVPGPHGARSGGGSSRAAETSGRRRSEATSSRWLRRCSRRLALVTAASASAGAIMPAAAASARRSTAGRRSGAGAGDQVTVADFHQPALRIAPAASSRRQPPRTFAFGRRINRRWVRSALRWADMLLDSLAIVFPVPAGAIKEFKESLENLIEDAEADTKRDKRRR